MGNIATYSVEVEILTGQSYYGSYSVRKNKSKFPHDNSDRYYPLGKNDVSFKGVPIKEKIVKMLHFENCTRQQAIAKGQKKGVVKSCRKVDGYEDLLSIEHLDLSQTQPATLYDKGNPYPNAIAMSEMPWNKKVKRKIINVATTI